LNPIKNETEDEKMYKTKTEHTLNSHKYAVDSIIYINADMTTTAVTLEAFLEAAGANLTEAQRQEQTILFRELKAESDENYRLEDEAARERSRNEVQLSEWSEKSIIKAGWTGSFLSKSLEEQLFGDGEAEAHQEYLERRKQIAELLPKALKVLTETQMRRLVMHKVDGYTTRKIAIIENITQQSAHDSITGARRKIEKFMKNNWKSLSK
jgi:DNA-directed RNA polymerase specialized sigma24 family protein